MSETKETKPQKDEVMESVAKEIETILTENGMALYPFLIRNESGDRASVRLVRVPKAETNEPEPTTEDTAGDSESVEEVS